MAIKVIETAAIVAGSVACDAEDVWFSPREGERNYAGDDTYERELCTESENCWR